MSESKQCEFCDGTGFHCEGDDQGSLNRMRCPGCDGIGAVVALDAGPPPESPTDLPPPE